MTCRFLHAILKNIITYYYSIKNAACYSRFVADKNVETIVVRDFSAFRINLKTRVLAQWPQKGRAEP